MLATTMGAIIDPRESELVPELTVCERRGRRGQRGHKQQSRVPEPKNAAVVGLKTMSLSKPLDTHEIASIFNATLRSQKTQFV